MTVPRTAAARYAMRLQLEDGIKGSSMFKEAVKHMIKPNGEMITIEESKELQKLYGFMQAFIYITVCIEILLLSLIHIYILIH